MTYAARLTQNVRDAAGAAALIPLGLAASAPALAYAPLWTLCHWLARTDEDHGDAPAILVWLTWNGRRHQTLHGI